MTWRRCRWMAETDRCGTALIAGVVLVLVLVAGLGVVACGRAMEADQDAGAGLDGGSTLVTGPPQWAMYGATPQRNGRSANVGPSQEGRYEVIELASEEDEARYVVVQAVGPQGAVYVTVRSDESLGRLLSLTPDGTRTWIYPPDSEPQNLLYGGVALNDSGHLFFEGLRIDYDAQPVSPPIYRFFDLDMSGVLAWAWPPEVPPDIVNDRRHSTPLFDAAGNVYVLFRSVGETAVDDTEQYLHSFAPDGQLRWRWERDVGGLLPAPPALGPDGTLYVMVRKWGLESDPEDGLYALDTDGNVLWSVLLFAHSIFNLAVGDDGTIYLAGIMDGEQISLRAVAPDGSVDWSLPFEPRPLSPPPTNLAIAPDGTIYLGSALNFSPPDPTEPIGVLFAASPAGVLEWSVFTMLAPYGGLAVDASNAVYTITRGYAPPTLLGFERDGTQRLSVVLDDTDVAPWFNHTDDFFPSSVVIGEGGRLYVGSSTGRLHIVHP